jgi:hypothetical protein
MGKDLIKRTLRVVMCRSGSLILCLNMKRILLFILSISSICSVIGQEYLPIVVENRHWVYQYRHQIDGGCNLFFIDGADVQYFKGDTIIGNFKYKRLRSSSLKIDDTKDIVFEPYTILETTDLAYFREDTTTRKVYVIDKNFGFACTGDQDDEFLLYDFSLKVGDSINDCLGKVIDSGYFDTTYSKIDSIVTVPFGGKEVRLFYTFGSFYSCGLVVPRVGAIVEGRGFEDGPLPGFYRRQLVKYCEDCDLISAAITDPKKVLPFNIFPNPVGDVLFLDFDRQHGNHVMFRIFDVNGKVVSDDLIDNQIDVRGLGSGVFYLSIMAKNGVVFHTTKFVKI